jgi:hypothetical protein
MIEVIDDLLTPSYCDSLYNLAINGYISYQYMQKTSYTDQLTKENSGIEVPLLSYDPLVKDCGQFSCTIMHSDLNLAKSHMLPCLWAFEQVKPMFYTVKDRLPHLGLLGSDRVKFNLLLKQQLGDHYNQPHVDISAPTYSMVYYLNDSDGDTVLFNEKYSPDNKEPITLTVKQRISPKKNRAVIFDGVKHAQGFCSQGEYRYVLVTTFL